MELVLIVFAVLVVLRWAGFIVLERLNLSHAAEHLQNSKQNEENAESAQKTLNYTTAKSRLLRVETTFATMVLIAVVFAKVLPMLYAWTMGLLGQSFWSEGAYLFGLSILSGVISLPFDWYRQFVLEERFGFNTSTQAIWWSDRFKMLCVVLILIYPFIVFLLFLVQWAGANWWLWAWGAILAYQLIMFFLGPLVILPLFNKFSPLPEGSLRDSIRTIAEKAGVAFRSIEVMDGSKRSKHSNAFFTGMGKFRKIALFDTLIDQLSEKELTSVVAHEMGHLKKKHIPKMLAWSCVLLGIELYLVSLFVDAAWLVEPFGFTTDRFVQGLVVVMLFASPILFWLSPLENLLSRKYEYEADAYAAEMMEESEPMITSLQTLESANLSNPYPHPWYSFFHYSHPTVQERIAALRGG